MPLRNGYDVRLVDGVVEADGLAMVKELLPKALCLGITAQTGYQIHEGLLASRAAKELAPGVPVVWGGWHPSALPEQTAAHPYVDVVVRGQGELTFLDLVHHFDEGRDIADVAGITYKSGGKIVSAPDRPFEDLNNFPPLPYELVDVERHIFVQEFSDRCLNYVSSQGCPWRCGFCADPRTYRRRWSALKPERVVNEIEDLVHRYDVDGFTFDDDNFFVSEKRVAEICRGIVERGLEIKWGCAPGRVDELLRYKGETWELMRKSGLEVIFTGAESGSDLALSLMTKDLEARETIAYHRRCKAHGIKVSFSFMMGLPHRPDDPEARSRMIEEEFHKTLTLIDLLIREGPHNIMFYFYTPYPGTPLYDLSKQCGLREPESLEEWATWDLETINAPWIAQKYRKILEQLMRYIFPILSGQFGRTGPTSPAFGWLQGFLKMAAAIRWRTRFFEAPIEHFLIKFYEDHLYYPRIKERQPRRRYRSPLVAEEAVASTIRPHFLVESTAS